MGISQNEGYPFRGPNNKDYKFLRHILGSPHFGKLPYWDYTIGVIKGDARSLGYSLKGDIWAVVEITVPSGIPVMIRHLIFRIPERDHYFDNHPYTGSYRDYTLAVIKGDTRSLDISSNGKVTSVGLGLEGLGLPQASYNGYCDTSGLYRDETAFSGGFLRRYVGAPAVRNTDITGSCKTNALFFCSIH